MAHPDDALLRQTAATLLFSRNFHRVSKNALDIFCHIFELTILTICKRVNRVSELCGRKADIADLLKELTRSFVFITKEFPELIEFEKNQPVLEAFSYMEDKGLVNSSLCLAPLPKIDGILIDCTSLTENTTENSHE